MRIAQVAHLFPPATGGIEHHVYHLSKELSNLKNEVTVYTTMVPGAKKEEKMDGIKVRRFSSLNFPLFSSVRFAPGMFFSLLSSDAEVFASHGYGSVMPLITSIAALLKRKPFVFTLHGYPKLKGKKKFFQLFYKYFFASIFLRIAKKVIVVSRASIQDIRGEVDEKKLIYIPNGIDTEIFTFQPPEGKNAITYVGRLDEYKGVDTLVRAYAKIKKDFPDTELWVVGKDEGIKEGLQKLANSLGVKIHFSEVPYEEMSKVYSDSAAVILPSKYEGFSLVWLEAMASGRPMFSTPVGDAPALFEQVYGKSAEDFLFKDEEELVKKLTNYLKDPQKHHKVIERAEYIVKEEYSWENVARLTLNTYKESLKR